MVDKSSGSGCYGTQNEHTTVSTLDINREPVAIKGGHSVHVRIITQHAAFCAFCKGYIPLESVDMLQWVDDGVAGALARLDRHLRLAHMIEYSKQLEAGL